MRTGRRKGCEGEVLRGILYCMYGRTNDASKEYSIVKTASPEPPLPKRGVLPLSLKFEKRESARKKGPTGGNV